MVNYDMAVVVKTVHKNGIIYNKVSEEMVPNIWRLMFVWLLAL